MALWAEWGELLTAPGRGVERAEMPFHEGVTACTILYPENGLGRVSKPGPPQLTASIELVLTRGTQQFN
jgi:hypothetical protein